MRLCWVVLFYDRLSNNSRSNDYFFLLKRKVDKITLDFFPTVGISFCCQGHLVCLEYWFMQFSVKYYLHFSGLFRKIEIWRQAHFTHFRRRCLTKNLGLFHKKFKNSLESYRYSEQCGELTWFYLTEITKFLKILDISKSVLIPWVHVHHHISPTNSKCYK